MKVVIAALLVLLTLAACAPIEPQPQNNETTQIIYIDVNDSVAQNETQQKVEDTQSEEMQEDEAVYTPKTDLRMTTCTDSDGGYKVLTKGSVLARGRRVYDVCVKDIQGEAFDSNTLIEYYCRGDRYLNQKFVCPHGCEDGACIDDPDTVKFYE